MRSAGPHEISRPGRYYQEIEDLPLVKSVTKFRTAVEPEAIDAAVATLGRAERPRITRTPLHCSAT